MDKIFVNKFMISMLHQEYKGGEMGQDVEGNRKSNRGGTLSPDLETAELGGSPETKSSQRTTLPPCVSD